MPNSDEPSPGAGWGPIAGSVGFLTIIPVPFAALSAAGLSRAIALFPLVGALLGALLGGIGMLLDRLLPPAPAAALILGMSVAVTGALHLDGLLDTTDGVFGGRTPEQRLAIMRDSRVGALGAITGAVILIGQFACLSELTGVGRLVALVAAFTVSRWVLVLALGLFPQARADGLGAAYHAAASRGACIAGTVLASAAAVMLGPAGIVALATGAAVLFGGGRFVARRLGGLTGDACGALAVITETAILFVFVAAGYAGRLP